jgi:hypothetical protein
MQNQPTIFEDSKIYLDSYKASGFKKVLGNHSSAVVTPTTTPVFGSSYTTIDLSPKGDDFLRDARLITVISAITSTGGTYRRGVNGLGLYMWDRMELWNGGKLLYTAYMDQVLYQLLYMTPLYKWARLSADIGWDTSTANRNTLAGSAQTFSIALKWIFDFFQKDIDVSLYKKLQLRLYPQTSAATVCQTDGTAPTFTITSCKLDMDFVTPKQDVVLLSRQMWKDNTIPKEIVHENFIKEVAISSGATSAVIDLPEIFDKLVNEIYFLIRPNTQLRSTAGTSDFTDNNTAITSWNIKSKNSFLNNYEADIDLTQYRRVIVPRMDLPNQQNIITRSEYIIPFSEGYASETDDKKSFVGFKKMPNQDIKLTLNFSALAANSTCTIFVRYLLVQKLVYGEVIKE